MPRKLLALVTALLAAALVIGATSPATAAPKTKPKVSLSTPKTTVIQWSTSTFKGKVNTKKAVGAKVSVQRKTTKGWKDIKKGKISKKRTYTLRFQTNSKDSLYRVKVHANKKVRTAYSRTVRVKSKPDPRFVEWTVESARARIVKDTNAFRVSQGLKPVTLDSGISKIAQDWTEHMARTRDLQHSKTYHDQIRALGWDYGRENIAVGQSPDEVVAAWIASPGHRATMLDPGVTHIGVGFAASGKYYTQNFGGFWPDEPDDDTQDDAPDDDGPGPNLEDPWDIDAARARILADTNALRATEGLPPLTIDPRLNEVAQAWTEQVARTKNFIHNPDYFAQYPPEYMRAGENMIFGGNPSRMVAGWERSPGHRANMMNKKYTHIGIGYAHNGQFHYGTQNFGGLEPEVTSH